MIVQQHNFNVFADNEELLSLLDLRKQQIQDTTDITLVIFQSGDSLDALNEALGFNVLSNHWNGKLFTETEFYPSWEYLELHPNWLEVAYLYNDEQGTLVFIERPLMEPLKSLYEPFYPSNQD